MSIAAIDGSDEVIFRLLARRVWESGGDGDATCVVLSGNVRQVAERFLVFIKPLSPLCEFVLAERGDVVSVACEQEYWLFVAPENRDKARAPWAADIWIEAYFEETY